MLISWSALNGTTSSPQHIPQRDNKFRQFSAIRTKTGSCLEDIRAIIGMAKKATIELDTIWKGGGVRKELKMKLVKVLLWPVIMFDAEEIDEIDERG